MKLDGAVKDLQKEKHELEAKLKNVTAALAAFTKLAAKPDTDAKSENNPNRATSPLTPVRAGPAQPANRAPGTYPVASIPTRTQIPRSFSSR
jgi:hypothetical protein